MVVRVGGSDVTKKTAQKEVDTEAEAVVATTAVVDMNAADTTVVEEVDLLVWGKLHSATAPRYYYTLQNMRCELSLNTSSLIN